MPRTYAAWFRLVAVAEAVSWAGLLMAMVLKYGYGQPQAVTVLGWIHGLMFTAYVVTCLIVVGPLRWSGRVLIAALVASVPPLASVVFERWATRKGIMTVPVTAEPSLWMRVGHVLRELN